MNATNIAKLADTIRDLYRIGRAKHVAFCRRDKLVEHDHPTEVRCFDAIAHLLCDMPQIHITWQVYDYETTSYVDHDVLFYADGHAESVLLS